MIKLHPEFQTLDPAELTESQRWEVEKLPRREGLQISRHHEPILIVTNQDGFPVGALWYGWVDGCCSFDVVVYLTYRNRGIARYLIAQVIAWYNKEREDYGHASMEVVVVSPIMKYLLEHHFQFTVARELSSRNDCIMAPSLNEHGAIVYEETKHESE